MHKSDRDSFRFLWVSDVLRNKLNIVVYRFSRVVFGVNSSPFLPNDVLRHPIGKHPQQDAQYAGKLSRSFHVDDLATGD